MPQQTFGVGTVPLVLKVGERVTLICSSGCSGFISVPGEAVAQMITAGVLDSAGCMRAVYKDLIGNDFARVPSIGCVEVTSA